MAKSDSVQMFSTEINVFVHSPKWITSNSKSSNYNQHFTFVLCYAQFKASLPHDLLSRALVALHASSFPPSTMCSAPLMLEALYEEIDATSGKECNNGITLVRSTEVCLY